MKITLVGLGCNRGDLSVRAKEAITSGAKTILRTALAQSAQSVQDCGVEYSSLDYIYEKSRNFDTLNKNLARAVLKESATSDVVYCVDGDVNDDNSCRIIMSKHKNFEIIHGISKSEYAVGKSGNGMLFSVSAYSVDSIKTAVYPLVVYDIDSKILASEVKLKLFEFYGEEAMITLYVCGKTVKTQLYTLDMYDGYDYMTMIRIDEPPLTQKHRYSFTDLMEVIKYLRTENGCPWDKAQTKESLRPALIEECYELIDAINKNDEDAMQEEIGDVLMQVVFHSVLAEERRSFTVDDVITGICEKLISRHTHVFGTDTASSPDEVLKLWDENKSKEKKYSSATEYLQAVPQCFPAALRAQKVGKRAAKYNFDFENIEQIFSKITEEINEVRSEINKGDENSLKEECGDLLFSCVNAVRFLGVDCEESLNISTQKFIDRFGKIEQAAKRDGKELKDLSAKQWDDYYNETKKY